MRADNVRGVVFETGEIISGYLFGLGRIMIKTDLDKKTTKISFESHHWFSERFALSAMAEEDWLSLQGF